jgi:uncharacterized membrane protein (UPF0136 family)
MKSRNETLDWCVFVVFLVLALNFVFWSRNLDIGVPVAVIAGTIFIRIFVLRIERYARFLRPILTLFLVFGLCWLFTVYYIQNLFTPS